MGKDKRKRVWDEHHEGAIDHPRVKKKKKNGFVWDFQIVDIIGHVHSLALGTVFTASHKLESKGSL